MYSSSGALDDRLLVPLHLLVERWVESATSGPAPCADPDLAEIECLGRRCGAGDRQAWDLLFPRVWPLLVGFVHRLYRGFTEHDAEDVAQAALEAAMRNAHTFRGRGLFRGWLFGIAARQASNLHRNRSARKRGAGKVVQLGEADDPHDERAASPAETLSARDRAAILHRALEALPPDDREIIQLHFFGDLTCEEIGQARGMNPKTVATRLLRARQALLGLLRRHHLTSHDG